MITKADELKALEKIKKIVETLGNDSYIATAFEGCFEVAEENIRNDFGCSLKQRAEAAEKELEKTKRELNEALERNAHLREEADEYLVDIEALNASILSKEDMNRLTEIVVEVIAKADKQAKEAANEIVKYADNPASNEFREAVDRNRLCKRTAETHAELYKRLIKIA
ncbi:MAG: hypothetical protein LIO87_02615 [Eubacterium sp.]|nr:hypothetical protein [Eubacterium sp.]